MSSDEELVISARRRVAVVSDEEEEEQKLEDASTINRRTSRRGLVNRERTKRLSALETLKQVREGGAVNRVKVNESIDDLYEEVDEEQYAAMRHEERFFVEDDDGGGYMDESDEEEEEAETTTKNKKIDKKQPKEKKSLKRTIKHMFNAISKKNMDESAVKLDQDDALNEILGSLIDEAGGSDTPMSTNVLQPMHRYKLPSRSSSKRQTSPSLAPRPVKISRTVVATRSPTLSPIPSPIAQRPLMPTKPSVPLSSFTEPLRNKSPTKNTLESTSQAEDSLPIFDENSMDVGDVEVGSTDILSDENADADCFDSCPVSGEAIRFYCLDMFEDANKHPGIVYLFGRIRTTDSSPKFESCCVVVRNVPRQLFFLKRITNDHGEPISNDELHQEVRERLQREFGISKLKSKIVEKKFLDRNASMPSEGTALEVWLSANFGRIPADLSGRTFSGVFNTTATSMERIVVECGIKGPCWLEITGAKAVDSHESHCRQEYELDMERMKSISVLNNSAQLPVPPVCVVSLNVLTALNRHQNEQQIVMISMIVNRNCSMERARFDVNNVEKLCFVTSLSKGVSLPFDFAQRLKQYKIEKCVEKTDFERALLGKFLPAFARLDPDMIMAHDWPSQLSILVERMEKYGIITWHMLSRLKRKTQLKNLGRSKFIQWELTAGRLCLNSKSAAEELVRSRSYEMEDLVEQILKPIDARIMRRNLSMEQITEAFSATNSKLDILTLINWNWKEIQFCARILCELNAIPLFLKITETVGGVLSRTLMGGRAERNEYLLLHSCYKNGYVPPDKYSPFTSTSSSGHNKAASKSRGKVGTKPHGKDTKSLEVDIIAEENDENKPPSAAKGTATNINKKSQYTGGLVLEPKKGLYSTYIVLLDFNSLYPSIIQEFNICFTTVPNAFADLNEADLPEMPGSSKPDGILKKEIRELVERRREVKGLMKKCDPKSVQYSQLNIRQMALKLTANSMYGCLGFPQSRFYAKTLAAMVTWKGRKILMHTKELVESEGFSVIYGDTDSIMVNTNSTDLELAKQVGQKLKQIVNRNYGLLELDIDGVYKKLLLLKKKKYAGLSVDLNDARNVKRELKGLDIVRRDWSVLAKEVGDQVVGLLLSERERDEMVADIRQLLTTLRKQLDAGEVPLEKFEILKQLTRNPTEYADAKSQPHVQVALRLNATKKFAYKQGDVVKYVICHDGTGNAPTQRAYHILEVTAAQSDNNLTIDINYYLTQQVHPVVARLCEPIEEIDAVQLAEALGIDASAFRRRAVAAAAAASNADDEEGVAWAFGTEQEFGACEGVRFECSACSRLNIIRAAVLADDGGDNDEGTEKKPADEYRYSFECCEYCRTQLVPDQQGLIVKQLLTALRAQVEKHLQCPFVCDDVTCAAECQLPSMQQWSSDGCVCGKCHNGILRKAYSVKQLFDQQCFYKTIFDIEAFLNNEKQCPREKRNRLLHQPNADVLLKFYAKCLRVVERYLTLNDFNHVNLAIVFAPLSIGGQSGCDLAVKKR